jgi:phospholipid transport system substrate-binding protein
MAKIVLGKYWKTLTPEEQKKFTKLFQKRIKEVYLNRINTGKNLTVAYKDAFFKGSKRIFSPLIFTLKKKDYKVLFKFWKSPNGWKVYDVEVEGVSIIRTYRSQFYDIMEKGGKKELFKKLEDVTKTK